MSMALFLIHKTHKKPLSSFKTMVHSFSYSTHLITWYAWTCMPHSRIFMLQKWIQMLVCTSCYFLRVHVLWHFKWFSLFWQTFYLLTHSSVACSHVTIIQVDPNGASHLMRTLTAIFNVITHGVLHIFLVKHNNVIMQGVYAPFQQMIHNTPILIWWFESHPLLSIMEVMHAGVISKF